MISEKEELAKELQRQYLREWRAKNPDKLRAYAKSYWQRKAEKATRGEGKSNETESI